MALRIRQLRIEVETDNGLFGAHLKFADKLVVLRAENTSGKSTCLNSIMYGLGLEGMLGPHQDPPLPDAMLRSLVYENRQFGVKSCSVILEIENGRKESITTRRLVTGPVKARQLVQVIQGPALSNPRANYESSDHFVRTAGAAQREAGFHRVLARFIGIDPPAVANFEGEEQPLYLECLFPFFFVEQLTGWRDIKARMPTYLQIPDMSKRALEYILDLDWMNSALRRRHLEREVASLREAWQKTLRDYTATLSGLGILLKGVPPEIEMNWTPNQAVDLLIFDADRWWSIPEYVDNLRARFASLSTQIHEIPRDLGQESVIDLALTEKEIRLAESRLQQLGLDARIDEQQIAAVQQRLASLEDDLQKHRDEKRLRERGAVSTLRTASGRCPTCDQPIKDTLLSQPDARNPMSLDQNIAFLEQQREVFDEVRRDAERSLQAKQAMIKSVRDEIEERRSLARRQREAADLRNFAPKVAQIQERLQVEARLDRIEGATKMSGETLDRLDELASRYTTVKSTLDGLKSSSLTVADRDKLADLDLLFRDQLQEYGFSSFPLQEVGISEETYRPSHLGYDLGFTSASDMIRSVWAYHLSLLEVARTAKTNHWGLLVFDEPKQQSAKDVSYAALLRRASTAVLSCQQVIFATSQEERSLLDMLKGLDVQYLPLPPRILRPLKSLK